MDIGELLVNLRDHPPKDYAHYEKGVSEACDLESQWEESLANLYKEHFLTYEKVSQRVERIEVQVLQDPIMIRKLILFFVQHMH